MMKRSVEQVENTESQKLKAPSNNNCQTPEDYESTIPGEMLMHRQNNRIQFSPCCSGEKIMMINNVFVFKKTEESDDDELRHRTNALFSKLAKD